MASVTRHIRHRRLGKQREEASLVKLAHSRKAAMHTRKGCGTSRRAWLEQLLVPKHAQNRVFNYERYTRDMRNRITHQRLESPLR